MKRVFMAQPGLIGATTGILFLTSVESIVAYIQHLAVAHLTIWLSMRTSNSNLGFLELLDIFRALFFGLIIGQNCGVALSEWLAGKREEAKSTLHTAWLFIFVIYAVFFSLPLFVFAVDLFNKPFLLIQKLPKMIQLYSMTLPLQIGVILWMLSRFLPDKSSKTTQVTENLRL